jgi:hypothetical protein
MGHSAVLPYGAHPGKRAAIVASRGPLARL